MTYESEKLDYTIIGKYTPDYVVKLPSGRTVYVEVKGYLRYADKRKLEAVKAAHPELDLRIVFYENKKLYKGSKTRYGDWADKMGIPWSVQSIPADWFQESE